MAIVKKIENENEVTDEILAELASNANKILNETSLRAIIIETDDLFGENDDEVKEDDPDFMQPMYEGYIEDDQGNEIDDTRTGRYRDLKSVVDELEEFASVAAKGAKQNISKCIYCDPHKECEEVHFMCEICGDGMCDDCYDAMKEHDGHYHLPLENCDSEMGIKLIIKACGNDDPAYICESCMTETMTNGKIAYIREDLEKLVGTRWKDKKHLQEHLQNTYELSTSLNDVDESGLVNDYTLIMSIFKEYGYMDIYYLRIPYGEKSIYVTEVSVSAE